MHFTKVKGILSSKNGMNLFRVCTHGCIYCDSRSKCYQMNHKSEDIEVKENGISLLKETVCLLPKLHEAKNYMGLMSEIKQRKLKLGKFVYDYLI